MKKIFFYCCMLVLSLMILSFRSECDNEDLYKKSIILHLSQTDTIFILRSQDIEIPAKIGNSEIIIVDDNAKSLLQNRESIYAIKLMPIEINKGNIEIIIVDFLIKQEKGSIALNNVGNEIFVYKYLKNKYKLIKRKIK